MLRPWAFVGGVVCVCVCCLLSSLAQVLRISSATYKRLSISEERERRGVLQTWVWTLVQMPARAPPLPPYFLHHDPQRVWRAEGSSFRLRNEPSSSFS